MLTGTPQPTESCDRRTEAPDRLLPADRPKCHIVPCIVHRPETLPLHPRAQLLPRAQLRSPPLLSLSKPPTLPAWVDMAPPLGWVARETPARAGGRSLHAR
jgi:hypothetical protein